MTIEFLDGAINSDQHRVNEFLRAKKMESLKLGESAFTDPSAVWMDNESLLWIDAHATIMDEDPSDSLVRVFVLEEGWVVDIVDARSTFTDDDNPNGHIYFEAQHAPNYANEGYIYKAHPVVGLITSQFEREQFASILATVHPELSYPGIIADTK